MPEVISAELRQVLRRLRLSPILETLPERLQLARQQKLPYQDFLELVLADEGARRDRVGGDLRARTAHLDPTMRLEAWDETTTVRFDHQLWNELCSLRFLEEAANVLILGPVGVGKTMLACCLGHIAVRRQRSVHFSRADALFKRLKAARLDATYDLTSAECGQKPPGSGAVSYSERGCGGLAGLKICSNTTSPYSFGYTGMDGNMGGHVPERDPAPEPRRQ